MPIQKPKRECGSCHYWNKWRHDGRGLCDKLDAAGKAQDGKGCKHWKGRKYNRNCNKIVAGVQDEEMQINRKD